MEVETQTLSTFDLKSKSPFSYGINLPIDSSDLHSQECRSYGMEMNGSKSDDGGLESPVSQLFEVESPAVGGRKCEEFDISGEPAVVGGLLELKHPASSRLESSYAVKVQKMYRGHRTRRRLADSAVVAEELWWQALDYARLNHSTISFFNFQKPETVASRWNRITLNASKVGKGLSKDAKAQKLAFQHWIEAIDPRHRYGHSLHLYYEEWVKADAGQPFFYWLDIGDGKEIDLKACPRSKLRQQCIKYLGPQERENYEYIVFEGRIVHKQTGSLLDTNKGPQGAKWIFVMSTFKKLYAGEKKKGVFHHSSFLAGGATLAAGRLVAEHGVLTSISAYSGHYRPTDDRLDSLLTFLSSNGVNLNRVKIHKANEDYDNYADSKSDVGGSTVEVPTKSDVPREEEKSLLPEPAKETQTATRSEYKRTLSGGLQSPRAEVPKKAILERINSKKAASSYQLGHQLTLKWSTGFGPRIGCVADYPLEVRQQALEFVNLSPRFPPTPSSCRRIAGLASPTAHLAPDFSNGDATSGI